MGKILYIFILSILMPLTLMAQNVGGEIIRKQVVPNNSKRKQSINLTENVYRVRNAAEFLNAIGSNRTIIIESPLPLELNDELISRLNNGTLQEHIMVDSKSIGLFADWSDGPGIVFANISNLTIKGTSAVSKITTESYYCAVIRMFNCSNIIIENLTLGHNEGTCFAPVIDIDQSKDVSFSRCLLFGCGTEGFVINNSINVKCNDSNIYKCSRKISIIQGNSNNIHFTNCKIFDIGGGLIVEKGSKNVLFDTCLFQNINGILFESIEASVSLNKCTISHESDKLGNISMVHFSDCTWR